MEIGMLKFEGELSESDKWILDDDSKQSKIVGKHIQKWDKTKSNFPTEKKQIPLKHILESE